MENKGNEKQENTKQETPETKPEINSANISPETAFIISKIVEAIESIGKNVVEYKKAEQRSTLSL